MRSMPLKLPFAGIGGKCQRGVVRTGAKARVIAEIFENLHHRGQHQQGHCPPIGRMGSEAQYVQPAACSAGREAIRSQYRLRRHSEMPPPPGSAVAKARSAHMVILPVLPLEERATRTGAR